MKKTITILILFSCQLVYSGNEIRVYHASGSALYVMERNSSGQVFHLINNVFEDFNDVNDYDITLIDKSGGMYLGNIDSNTPVGYYTLIAYSQTGAEPNITDDTFIGYEEGYWNGSVWFNDANQLQTIKTNLGYVDTDMQSVLSNQTVINNNITDSNSTIIAAIDSGISDVNDSIDDLGFGLMMVYYAIDANFVDLRTAMDANFASLSIDVNDIDANDIATAVWDKTASGSSSYSDVLLDIWKRIKRFISLP